MKQLFKNAETFINNKNKIISFETNNGIITKIYQNNNANDKDYENIIDLENKFIYSGFININSQFLDAIVFNFFCDASEAKNIKQLTKKINSYYKSFILDDQGFIGVFGINEEVINEKEITKKYLDELEAKCRIVVYLKQANKFVLNSAAIKYVEEFKKNIKFDKDGIANERDNSLLKTLIPPKSEIEFIHIFKALQEKAINNGITTVGINIQTLNDFYSMCTLISHKLLKIDFFLFLEYFEFSKDENILSIISASYQNNLRIAGFCLNLDKNLLSNNQANLSNLWYTNKLQLKKVLQDVLNAKQLTYIVANNLKSLTILLEVLNDKEIKDKYDLNKIIVENNISNPELINQIKELKLNVVTSSDLIWTYYNQLANENEIVNKLDLNKTIIDAEINLMSSHKFLDFNFNIFESIWSLTNRKSNDLNQINEQEIISVNQALDTFTTNVNKILLENKNGLAINQIADLIVLNQNPFKIEKEYLSSVKVIDVYKKGIKIN